MQEVSEQYQKVRHIVSLFLHTFFYKIEVAGIENIPQETGGLLIAGHPNGMIDPGLIVTSFPRQIVFGARHGLFSWPLLGAMMKNIGTVPIYRRQDLKHLPKEEQRKKNERSLKAMATTIANGSYAALFPEGVSHDQPFLKSLKTGAARIYHQALQESSNEPVIIPVGLYYDQKNAFRSRALVQFFPPMKVTINWDKDLEENALKERLQELTDRMEETLQSVVLAVESWELQSVFYRAGKLVRAEQIHRAGTKSDKPDLEEEVLGLSRIWIGYQTMKDTHPDLVAELIQQVTEYNDDMEALGIEDHELDGDPRLFSARLLMILLLQTVLYFFVFPPILMVGYVINLPTALLVKGLSKGYSSLKKDQASVKLFSSVVLFPVTWMLWGGIGYLGYVEFLPASTHLFPRLPDLSIAAAVFVSSLAMLSCIIMFTYIKAARRVLRAVKVRVNKRHNKVMIEDLAQQRSRLCDRLMALAEQLDLPGTRGEDGRLRK